MYITPRSETAAVSEQRVMSKRALEKPSTSNKDYACVQPQGPVWQRSRGSAPLTGGPVVETRCEASLPALLQSASFLFAVKPGLEWRRKRRVSRSVSGPGHPQRSRNGGSNRVRTSKQRLVWRDGLRSGGAALVRLTRVCAAWSETHLISSCPTLELPWSGESPHAGDEPCLIGWWAGRDFV